MISLDFNKRFGKESRKISVFLIVLVLTCIALGILFPELVNREGHLKEVKPKKDTLGALRRL